jgi:hypothetical protein
MTCGVNQSAIFDNRATAYSMRRRKVIVLGIAGVNVFPADATVGLVAAVDLILFRLVKNTLRIQPDPNSLDDCCAPACVVLRNPWPRGGLDVRLTSAFSQDVVSQFLDERLVELEVRIVE